MKLFNVMEVTRGLLLDSLKGSDNFDKCVYLARYLYSELGGAFSIEHGLSDTYELSFHSFDIEDAMLVVFRGSRCTVFLSDAAQRIFIGPFSGDDLSDLLEFFGIE